MTQIIINTSRVEANNRRNLRRRELKAANKKLAQFEIAVHKFEEKLECQKEAIGAGLPISFCLRSKWKVSGIDALYKELKLNKIVYKNVSDLNERFISRLNTRHAMLTHFVKGQTNNSEKLRVD